MIHLLAQRDYDIALAYLNRDPLHNIYLVHNLRTYGLENNYGLESNQGAFWGAFNSERLEGVLFANRDGGSCTGFLTGDNREVLAQLGKFALESGIWKLIGKSTYIQPAIEHLYSRVRIGALHLDFYETHPGQLISRHDYPVRAATGDDISLLVELYRNYELYGTGRTEEDIEHEIRKVMDESGTYFLIEWENRIVSAARVSPEIDQAGMIDAATTLPEFRGRGMYPCVRTACVEHLFRRGKIGLGLIRDTNTNMKKVISKSGGSCTAKWLIVDFSRKPPLRRRILPLRLRRWGLRMKGRVFGE